MLRHERFLAAFALVAGGLDLGCASQAGMSPVADAGKLPMPMLDAAAGSAMDAGIATGAPDATPPYMLIDDSGTALLPDGAVIYVRFSARPCPSDNTLTYENFGAAFFTSYCRRCHSATKEGSERNDAPVSLNFDDLQSISGLTPAIWSVAGDSNAYMPAAPPKPSPEERAKLGAWLACRTPAGDLDDAGTP